MVRADTPIHEQFGRLLDHARKLEDNIFWLELDLAGLGGKRSRNKPIQRDEDA
jgi:hypothetical protein